MQPPVLSVYAKRQNTTEPAQPLEAGATLATGDAISIRVRSTQRAYVYVIAVGASGSAVLLQPFSEQPEEALMPAQMRRTIPGDGAVLPLDRHVGNETLIAVATPTPVRDPRAMLLEIETRAARGGALDSQAFADFGEATVFTFRHVPGAEILSQQPANRPILFANSPAESGVLSGAGSRIRALLDGVPAPQRPVQQPAPQPPVAAATTRAPRGTESSASVTATASAEPETSPSVPQLEARQSRLNASQSRSSSRSSAASTPAPDTSNGGARTLAGASASSDTAQLDAGQPRSREPSASVSSSPVRTDLARVESDQRDPTGTSATARSLREDNGASRSAAERDSGQAGSGQDDASQGDSSWLTSLFASPSSGSNANDAERAAAPAVSEQDSRAPSVGDASRSAAAQREPVEVANAPAGSTATDTAATTRDADSGSSWFSSLFSASDTSDETTTSATDTPSSLTTLADEGNVDQPATPRALRVPPDEPVQAFSPPVQPEPAPVVPPIPAPASQESGVVEAPPQPVAPRTVAPQSPRPVAPPPPPTVVPPPPRTALPAVAPAVEVSAAEPAVRAPASAPSQPAAPAAPGPVTPDISESASVRATEAESGTAEGGSVFGALASFFAPSPPDSDEGPGANSANETRETSTVGGSPKASADANTANDSAFLSFDRIPDRGPVVTPAVPAPRKAGPRAPAPDAPAASAPARRSAQTSASSPPVTPPASAVVESRAVPANLPPPATTAAAPASSVATGTTTAASASTAAATGATAGAVSASTSAGSSSTTSGTGFFSQLAGIFTGGDATDDDGGSAVGDNVAPNKPATEPAPLQVVESAPVVAAAPPPTPTVPPPLKPGADEIKIKLPQIASGPITVRTADPDTPPPEKPSAPPKSEGVLSAAGSRIASLLGFGGSSDDAPSSSERGEAEATSESVASAPGSDEAPAVAQPLVVQPSAATGAAPGNLTAASAAQSATATPARVTETGASQTRREQPLAADSATDDNPSTSTPVAARAEPATSTPPAPAPEPARIVTTASQPALTAPAASGEPEQVVAAIPARPVITVAPTKPSLVPLALTPQQALVELDPSADDNASAAMMLVVTPASTGSALLIDDEGHLLTTWHLVRGFSRVTVWPKAPGQAVPDTATPLLARVVRANRNSDLALLVIEGAAPAVEPVVLAESAQLERGELVHVLGHADGDRWTHVMARHVRHKPRHSWVTAGRFVHREAVLSNQAASAPDATGGALFNGQMQLVGINVQVGRRGGQLYSIAVDSIRRFLSGELAADPSPSG